MRILFVCLGNICRSPMAHGLLRHKAAESDEIYIDSAGTSAFHEGEPPDSRAISTLKKYGIDISDLRSRPVTEEDFRHFDVIYAMDASNFDALIEMKSSLRLKDGAQIKMVLSELDSAEFTSVPDPYYGGHQGFELVYDLLDRATNKIMSTLR